MSSTITHWLNGARWAGTTDREAEVTNPATGQVRGTVVLASEFDAQHVIESATRAAGGWGAASPARRTQVVFAFRALLNSRRDDLAAIITAEHGKVHSDAVGEVASGQEVVEFACGTSHPLRGGTRLPRHGPHVVLPDRDRARQRRGAQA